MISRVAFASAATLLGVGLNASPGWWWADPAADTGWQQILMLYDQLLAYAPIPVVALHRAVAVAEVQGS